MVISLLVLLFLPFFFYPPYSPYVTKFTAPPQHFLLRGRLLRYRCPEPVLIHHRSCSCALCYKDKREGNRQRKSASLLLFGEHTRKAIECRVFFISCHTGQKETRDIGMASQKDRLSFLNSEITPSWVCSLCHGARAAQSPTPCQNL